MEWTTHALSGVATGYLITNDWKGALVGGIASVLPDLDEPRSKFGKPFFFISLPLNQLVGHRTLTHSIWFALLIGITSSIFFGLSLGIATVVGVLAHIVGDMATGKVRVLFPLKFNVGIHTSRIAYILIDRVTRLALLVFIGITAYRQISLII